MKLKRILFFGGGLEVCVCLVGIEWLIRWKLILIGCVKIVISCLGFVLLGMISWMWLVLLFWMLVSLMLVSFSCCLIILMLLLIRLCSCVVKVVFVGVRWSWLLLVLVMVIVCDGVFFVVVFSFCMICVWVLGFMIFSLILFLWIVSFEKVILFFCRIL